MGDRHAVVLGAGMSGLLAAAALARHFDVVTVVERDRFPETPVARRGVPQGKHVHGLLARGSEAMERLLPGLSGELAEAGALIVRPLLETRYVLGGGRLARGDTGSRVVLATRPLLEDVVRRRVAALPQVTLVEAGEVTGPVHEAGRITGVRVVRRPGADPGAAPAPGAETATAGAGGAPSEEVLEAELVVDALGRAGRSAGWLPQLGGRAPDEDRVKVDLGYSSRFVRLPEGVFGRDHAILTGIVPGYPGRGIGLLQQESDRWLVTLAGMAGDHPGSDDEAFAAFLRTAAPPEVAEVVAGAEPLSGIATYRVPDGIRRRYERLQAPPEGLVAVGDAHCSFNPVYGQGMTVAAMEALELDAALAAGGTAGLPRRYYRAAAKVVRPAWQLAVGADLSVPEVPGRRPPGQRLVQRYTERLQRTAWRDPEVAVAFVRMTSLLDPPSGVFAPRVLARVLRDGASRGATDGDAAGGGPADGGSAGGGSANGGVPQGR